MKQNHLLWNIAAALLLCASAASCSQDDMPQTGGAPLPDGEYPLAFTASVDGMATRSTGKDGWAEGDKIGVRIGADGATGCYELNHEDGTIKEVHTPVYWQNTAPATVTAWYPFEAQTAKDIANQSNGYGAIDFLKATAENKRFTDKVELNFIHQMAKVKCMLAKDASITDEEFKGAKAAFYGYTFASFENGELTGTDNGWITPTATDCEALLVPQDMTGKPLIKVSINDNYFIYTPDTKDACNLQAGYQHSYTITVKANGIEVTTVTGSSWNGDDSEDVVSKEVTQTFSATDLKLGDFFYSDGTHGDGGLRTIYTDGTYRIDDTVVPDPNKTCIGIVFYAGQHGSDDANYSKTGVGQEKCRGYVVALTDVHDDRSDRLRWEYGPKNEYNQVVGTSTSTSDWQGYSNNLKFHEFVNDNEGWEMKHFPAALACETYGNRTLDWDGSDADGKYNWQKPLVAPSNTSGWFLPSRGQLQYLSQNRSVLSARMTDVKNNTPTDCSYKDKIKWFSTSCYYWSSTESSQDYAWNVFFYNNNPDRNLKHLTNAVRAILAF